MKEKYIDNKYLTKNIFLSLHFFLVRPRDAIVEVGPQGTCILRLLFPKAVNMSSKLNQVFLFVNDCVGQGEECFQFNLIG